MKIHGFHKLENRTHIEVDDDNNHTYTAKVMHAQDIGSYYSIWIDIENEQTGILNKYIIKLDTKDDADIRMIIIDQNVHRTVKIQYNDLYDISYFLKLMVRCAIIPRDFY